MKVDATFLIQDREIPEADASHVQFTRFQEHSYVAGPGRRCVLWVSGCHRRCPGCFQSHFFSFDAGRSVSIEALAAQIVSIEDVDGLSISGGEPFEQSEALSELCRQIRRRSKLTILAYTGYTLETLAKRKASDQALLEQLDWLIDGEYRDDQRGPYLWRGSANQRLIPIGGASAELARASFTDGELDSVQITLDDSRVVIGGFPDPKMESNFRESLARRGIILSCSQQEPVSSSRPSR